MLVPRAHSSEDVFDATKGPALLSLVFGAQAAVAGPPPLFGESYQVMAGYHPGCLSIQQLLHKLLWNELFRKPEGP